ncbi:MAG: V-type ATPase subunit [Clostridiales bacterium]|nr:V-type ATPase subunit [Clostridiales bacterium]
MSGSLRKYSGITTKSKAKQGKLFKEEDYEELMSLGSVREYVLYLKNTDAYRSYFESFNENIVHRGQIEKTLKATLYESYESLYRFADRKQRKQLALVYLHYEISMLSECLERLYSKTIDIDYKAYARVLNDHIAIPMEKLVEAKTIDEFIADLKGTPYENVLQPIVNSKNYTLFDLLMHLNCYYYKTVWKLKDKVLDKSQDKSFTKCIGTKIDIMNIMMIYRCKKYYQVDRTKMIAILIPVNYKLKKEQLKELMAAETVSDFIAKLQETEYKVPGEHITQEDMERAYYKKTVKMYTDSKAQDPLSMAPIFCYLFQKERELDNLTTILEGIRYGMDRAKIREYLIL